MQPSTSSLQPDSELTTELHLTTTWCNMPSTYLRSCRSQAQSANALFGAHFWVDDEAGDSIAFTSRIVAQVLKDGD